MYNKLIVWDALNAPLTLKRWAHKEGTIIGQDHSQRVKESLKALQVLEKAIVHLNRDMLLADNGKLFPVDLLACGALKRALSMSCAFRLIIERWNLVAARALIRMQIDTATRLSVLWLVDDPHQFARELLSGSRINNSHFRFQITVFFCS